MGFEQLIDREQCTHPVHEPGLPDPSEFRDREVGGKAAAAAVAFAIADDGNGSVAASFYE